MTPQDTLLILSILGISAFSTMLFPWLVWRCLVRTVRAWRVLMVMALLASSAYLGWWLAQRFLDTAWSLWDVCQRLAILIGIVRWVPPVWQWIAKHVQHEDANPVITAQPPSISQQQQGMDSRDGQLTADGHLPKAHPVGVPSTPARRAMAALARQVVTSNELLLAYASQWMATPRRLPLPKPVPTPLSSQQPELLGSKTLLLLEPPSPPQAAVVKRLTEQKRVCE